MNCNSDIYDDFQVTPYGSAAAGSMINDRIAPAIGHGLDDGLASACGTGPVSINLPAVPETQR
jgi:hypothetical protein